MKKIIFLLPVCLLLYLIFRYFSDGLIENTRGISTDILNSKANKTFITEYRYLKNTTLDSVLGGNLLNEIWLEKAWFYKRWGNREISDQDYTFVMDIKGVVNTSNYDSFNKEWDIQLSGTKSHDSLLYSTRNGDKYIVIGKLSQVVGQLDTLIFDVSTLNKYLGQIQFVARR